MLRLLLLLAAVAAGCAPARPSAPGPVESRFDGRDLSLVVEAEGWASEVVAGDVLEVRASVRNEGGGPVHVEFGADAVKLRATPRTDLGTVDWSEIPTGVVWTPSFTAGPAEVIAIGYAVTLAPGESAPLPPLDVPVTLDAGLYTVSACARLRTAVVASASEWCTGGVPLTVR